MVVIIRGADIDARQRLLSSMFEDRKRLFVDLLKWDVPVSGGRFEIDRFDDEHATYLIAVGDDGVHAGSIRLLPACRPHILSDLFPGLCSGDVPRGPSILEITRLCLPTRHGAAERLRIRNMLISAMVDHALANAIETLTGVVEAAFLAKILDMGWNASPLGELQRLNNRLLGAFRIELDQETPGRLARKWIYTPATIMRPAPMQPPFQASAA